MFFSPVFYNPGNRFINCNLFLSVGIAEYIIQVVKEKIVYVRYGIEVEFYNKPLIYINK